jgi:uncharacterized membrane protein
LLIIDWNSFKLGVKVRAFLCSFDGAVLSMIIYYLLTNLQEMNKYVEMKIDVKFADV